MKADFNLLGLLYDIHSIINSFTKNEIFYVN